MPEILTQPQPTSNQKALNWKRIIIAAVVAAFVIGLGVLIFLLFQPKEEVITPTTTKKATSSAKKDETAYFDDYKFTEKDYARSGPIIDVNLSISQDNTVTEAEPTRITDALRTSPSILANQKGDYILEVGTKNDRHSIGTILWNQSFPVYFDYTGPVFLGKDYSDIKWEQVYVGFRIPYEPEMKALRLWYLKAEIEGYESKVPKIIFFKELP